MAFCLTSRSHSRKETYTHGESNTVTEPFQHFVSELKESFWGDLQGHVQQGMQRRFELLSERQRDLYMVSPQTVSRLTRELDEAVRAFHQAPLEDAWAYLFRDGVSLRMRQPRGRQRVHMLVAYGVRATAPGNCWRFCAARGRARVPGKGCWRICTAVG